MTRVANDQAAAADTSLSAVIGDANVYDVLPRLLAAAALDGVDVGDLLGHGCSEGTRQLPRGMDLTCNRSGSWEASHIEALTDPSAITEGPGPAVLDVECLTCDAMPGDACWWTEREAAVYVALLHTLPKVSAELARLWDVNDATTLYDENEDPWTLLREELAYTERPRAHGSRVTFAANPKVIFIPGTTGGWML